MPSDQDDDAYTLAVRIARAMDEIGARHLLVGSVASSLHGDPRSTNDIDFVTSLTAAQVGALAAALGDDFDVDQNALADAMRSGGSWNIFFTPLMSKVDLFAFTGSELQQVQLARAVRVKTDAGDLNVLSPADCVLSKLSWFRDGGGVSDQQWRDILGVLRANELDVADLRAWAARLDLQGLLEKALKEAKGGSADHARVARGEAG
jgi:hypothetical protein